MHTIKMVSINSDTRRTRRRLAHSLSSFDRTLRKLHIGENSRPVRLMLFDALVIAREDLPFRREDAYAR